MPSLYQLNAEYEDILEQIPDDGEIPDSIAMQLEQAADRIEKKLEHVLGYLRNCEGELLMLAHEIERFQKRKDALVRKVVWLREYVQQSLRTMGIERGQFGLHKVRIQNNPPKVVVTDLSRIPHVYDKEQERQVSLSHILKDIKAGVEVPGCEVVVGQHLRIS